MIVIGFDPSVDGAAFAVLECGVEQGIRRFIDKGDGSLDVCCDQIDVAVATGGNVNALVAVEKPSGIHIPPPKAPTLVLLLEAYKRALMLARSSGTSLMYASYACGALARHAKSKGVRVVELAPDQWRSALQVSSRSKDVKQDVLVKAAIKRHITGWPERSNDHVRDAAGVALAAYWQVRATRKPGPEVFGG